MTNPQTGDIVRYAVFDEGVEKYALLLVLEERIFRAGASFRGVVLLETNNPLWQSRGINHINDDLWGYARKVA